LLRTHIAIVAAGRCAAPLHNLLTERGNVAMHRHTLSETANDMASARSSRAPSFSSDRPSVASSITFQMPSSVRPSPAYIAASVASQTVTDHHNAQRRDDDPDSDELENAVFSEQALALLNAFLDHLLFAFLSSARSPSLTAIRPAIADVLKPRLAREATEAADEELQGLLAGEDEEFPAADGKAADRWDVEKVWKRTRLRIMVYTRLGELEDEDEEKYVLQERGLSMDDDDDDEAGLVSWASAIFLTSVVEYIAEQTLLVAGSAAYARMAAKMKKLALQVDAPVDLNLERLIVEEPDVEKIALNSALGRLWRTWRKRVRSPLSPGRGLTTVASYGSLHRRKMSHDTMNESTRDHSPIPEHIPTETDIAANIPLPLGDNDVNEIEVPGLAQTYETDDESTGSQTPVPRSQRPTSAIILAPAETFRRRIMKERPVSMPHPPSEFRIPPFRSKRSSIPPETPQTPPFETPMEYASQGGSYMGSEEVSSVPSQISEEHAEASAVQGPAQSDDEPAESPQEADADMMAFAASTGMGFRMSVVDPIRTEVPARHEDEPELPSATSSHESEPTIMQSKRMSMDKPGPPGVVRTYSMRSSSRSGQPTPVASPRLSQQGEPTSYLDDSLSTDDEAQPSPIGIARTSDVPIRSTPTPDMDTPTGRYSSQGGYVEVQPRQTSTASIPVRNTPTPDAKPVVPERSISRPDSRNREASVLDHAPAAASQLANITSHPRRQEMPPPRGASLPSLQEVDTNPRQRTVSEASTARSTHQHSPSQSSRSERLVQYKTPEETRRPQHPTADGSPSSEKSGVQRVASTSSKKSGNLIMKHSSRGSETSLRSQIPNTRMSKEDQERQFESLVNGEETVKFTLTPQTVRDFDVGSIPAFNRLHTDFDRSRLFCKRPSHTN
jgi:hypothetical protein